MSDQHQKAINRNNWLGRFVKPQFNLVVTIIVIVFITRLAPIIERGAALLRRFHRRDFAAWVGWTTFFPFLSFFLLSYLNSIASRHHWRSTLIENYFVVSQLETFPTQKLNIDRIFRQNPTISHIALTLFSPKLLQICTQAIPENSNLSK